MTSERGYDLTADQVKACLQVVKARNSLFFPSVLSSELGCEILWRPKILGETMLYCTPDYDVRSSLASKVLKFKN